MDVSGEFFREEGYVDEVQDGILRTNSQQNNEEIPKSSTEPGSDYDYSAKKKDSKIPEVLSNR